jgi:hypothetical protein
MSRETETEERRMAILQILLRDSDYSVNDNIIQKLLAELGIGVGLTIVRSDIEWFEQKNLVMVQELPMCYVVTLRRLGVEVAKGLTVMPGVARQMPES